MAALDLHGGRDVITDPGSFPRVDGTGLPVNNAARQLILHGPSSWHDWLPYWMPPRRSRRGSARFTNSSGRGWADCPARA